MERGRGWGGDGRECSTRRRHRGTRRSARVCVWMGEPRGDAQAEISAGACVRATGRTRRGGKRYPVREREKPKGEQREREGKGGHDIRDGCPCVDRRRGVAGGIAVRSGVCARPMDVHGHFVANVEAWAIGEGGRGREKEREKRTKVSQHRSSRSVSFLSSLC